LEDTDISVESIMDEVVAGATVHATATEIFIDKFEFYGKTLSQWLADMAIQFPEGSYCGIRVPGEIPKGLTPEDMRFLYMDLIRKVQRASNYYSIASSIHGSLVAGGDIKKSDLVASLVARYEAANAKRPSVVALERMADSYLNSTVHTCIAAKIVKDFWKERRDTLVEIRKCLEQIGISKHTEMKYLET